MPSSDRGARRKIRVVIVTENFLPKVDGVIRCLARLLKHLREEGHEAVVLGPEAYMSSYETHPVIGTAGLPLVFYPGLKLNFLRPKFLETIVEFDPDVVHVVDPIWLGPQVLFALRNGWCGPKWSDPQAPIVASFHTNLPTYASSFGLNFMESIMWTCIKTWHSQCRLTACPTLSTATMLMRKGVQNTRVWPRGIDLDMFGPHRRCYTTRRAWGVESVSVPTCTVTPGDAKSLPTPPPSPAPSDEQEFLLWKDRCVILYVGRLSHEKNLFFLIETFAILLRLIELPSLPPLFVFVGDGPVRHDLEDRCLQKEIPAIFVGHRSGEDLAKCYASADVFAFPSYTETFGQVVLEALASGLPVVGLDADGTRDLVQHERTGLLLQHGPNRLDAAGCGWQQQFDPRNPRRQVLAHQYAALLRRLVTNTTLRRVMAARASTSAPVTKSWDDAMGCIVDCYEEARAVCSRQSSGDWFDKEIAWPSQSPSRSTIWAIHIIVVIISVSFILYLCRLL
ncbi:hypothetical protein FRC12_011848 [Ceratobasidium sp. 428]|nr:hypothetical protein FRC12_011848 [Ceratobasidium sp. 428]